MMCFIPVLAPSICCKRGRLLIITNISCLKGIFTNLSTRLEQHLKGNTVPWIILACVSPATKSLIARTGHCSSLIQSSAPALSKSNGRIEKSSDTKKRCLLPTVLSFLKKKKKNHKPSNKTQEKSTSCVNLRNY